MRIGCLFGTFDPPHLAHVAVAEHLLHAAALDQVWFVVTPSNPFKQDRILGADQHRMAMVRLAVQHHDRLVASGFELDLPRPSYTVDSLRFMRQRWAGHDFQLIMGSDNLASFHLWKQPEEILEHHRILVYPRSGWDGHLSASLYNAHPQVELFAEAPMVEVSSTEVREAIRTWRPVDHLLDPTVLAYIRQHRLYEA